MNQFPPFIANASKTTMLKCLRSIMVEGSKLDIITSSFEVATLLQLDHWQSTEKIRILVGHPAKIENRQVFLQNLFKNNEHSIENAKLQDDSLVGLADVRDALTSGKIEIRGYLKDKLHASAYLVYNHADTLGGIIGSSNFTFNDLNYGIELNASVTPEGSKEISRFFNLLFERAEDIGPEVIKQIERHIRPFTPYEVYLKSLHEYFRGREIPVGVWEQEYSKVYKILSDYQRDAYRQLLRIADRYQGALLCDGVGLGKTFVALMLIERMIQERKRVVVVVPKSAREAVWETALQRYIPEARSVFGNLVVVYNHTDLLRGASEDRDFPAEFDEVRQHADIVIVDEAHHFRTPWAKRSQKLFELTKGKLMFLLTATPINNSLFDLQHLIEYFTRRDDSRFAHLGINSVRGYLIQKEKLIEQRMQVSQSYAQYEETLFADFDSTYAESILNDDRLFREVVVQRSRTYVKQREQLGEQQTLFPERQPPQVAAYSLKATYGKLLDLIGTVFDREDPLLKLAIYYPLAYAKRPSDSPEERKEANRQNQVVGLVRTTLLVREMAGRQHTLAALH
jgi:SNF2 family DNA or RNA helicase